MRRFPRDVRDFHNVVAPVPMSENDPKFLGFASSGGGASFFLSPGYQVIEGGIVPQVFPGQQHDASPPPVPSNPPLPVSAAPQSVGAVSSPLPPAAPSSSPPTDPSTEPAPPASALPSGSSSAQISAAISATSPSSEVTPSLSSSPLGSIPPTLSGTVATATDPILSSLAPISPTSSPTTNPAAAITNSMDAHGASFWAGIALLGIAGVATLLALFLWWLRIRERTHRHPWERPRWLWGRAESYKFPEDAISSSGTSGSLWQPNGDREVGEPQRSTSSLLSPSLLSRRTSGREPPQPHLPTIAAMSPFMHGPYPTVRPLPLELRQSDTSVPGLMQDVGSLHVANLVAGDILTSGDESSRPPTALDDVGTPRESSLMLRPRYLSLNGSGLDVPWIQTPPAEPKPEPVTRPGQPRTRRRSADATTPSSYNRWKERLERSSAKPEEPYADPQPVTIETWRDSLRNNIASALGAFTSTAHPHAHAPVRPSVTTYDWQGAAPAVARAPSTTSTASKPWTLEETREGAGIVHIRGVPNPFASSSYSLSRNSSSRSRPLPTPPHASLIPPRLPHLPPMPHVPRTSASAARSTSMRRQHGSRRRRRGMVRHASSLSSASSSSVAASEATSVGSDMSRASGFTAVARWARLSEKEAAARRALRQRRLRSVGGSSVRNRTRGRGAGGG